MKAKDVALEDYRGDGAGELAFVNRYDRGQSMIVDKSSERLSVVFAKSGSGMQ